MRNCDYSMDSNGTAHVTLDRSHVNNALDKRMIRQLTAFISAADRDPKVRQLVLQANGTHFCSGMDLKWLESNAREADLSDLADLFRRLYFLEKPTIAVVQGSAYGGGAGLVACCDIVLASPSARFCFSEVRLGLIPAIISPYIVQAIGPGQTRRYFLTADVFDAAQALHLGLVHVVDTDTNLNSRLKSCIDSLQAAGPEALKQTKKILNAISGGLIDPQTSKRTAHWSYAIRQSAEAREGLRAFRKKRHPDWHH